MATTGLRIGLVALLGIMLAGSAPAQVFTPETGGLNYSVTAGAAFPVGDTADSSTFLIGFNWYGPVGPELGERAAVGLSVDWTQISRNDGKEVNVFPVLLNYKAYGLLGGYRIFTNLGLGLLASSEDIPEMELDDGLNFGWALGLGLDMTERFYGEIRFIAGSNPGDDGLIGAQLGYRF